MTKRYDRVALKATPVAELRKVAKQIFDAEDIKGLTKAQLVELLAGVDKDPIHTLESHEAEMPDCDDPDCEFHHPEVIETTPYDQPAIDRANELEDDDELDDEEDDEEDDITLEQVAQAVEKAQAKAPKAAQVARETYTAKQIATRIGTDAKTLRKFFRATDRAVGQGGRYDFPAAMLPEIDKAFKAWSSKKPGRLPKSDKPKITPSRVAADSDEDELELDLDDELEDDEIDDTARLAREAELIKLSPLTLRKLGEPLGIDHRLRKADLILAILDEEFNITDDDEEDD